MILAPFLYSTICKIILKFSRSQGISYLILTPQRAAFCRKRDRERGEREMAANRFLSICKHCLLEHGYQYFAVGEREVEGHRGSVLSSQAEKTHGPGCISAPLHAFRFSAE